MKYLLILLLICSCSHYVKLDKSIPSDFEYEVTKTDTSCEDGRKIVEHTVIIWYPVGSCPQK
jgi:hypothetical protein